MVVEILSVILENEKCVQLSHCFMLLALQCCKVRSIEVFLLLGLYMFLVKFKNSTTYASMWHQAMEGLT